MSAIPQDGDGGLRAISIAGVLAVAAGMIVPTVVFAGGGGTSEAGPNLVELEAVEASLAYKKPNQPKQPEKKFKAPEPVTTDKPAGLSSDDQKKPVLPKPDEAKKPAPNAEDLYKKFKRDDDDLATGKPAEENIGAFDGSEYGFAEESRGDPYFQKLVADLVQGWDYPEILGDQAGVPVGCLHLDAAGKIVETKFKEKSGKDELDDSIERQLSAVKKQRAADPVPVPVHLLKAATTKWVCFKFRVKK